MPTPLQYMQFSLGVYNASKLNKIDPPTGWTSHDWQPDMLDGFSAGTFVKGNEVVVSYTGTNGGLDYANWFIGAGLEMLRRVCLVLAMLISLTACGADAINWNEEVKLLDGRVITVSQKNRVEEDVSREFWLTFKLPEFSNQEIVWHENLMPMVLNVYQNKLYVIGHPHTTREFRQYGRPAPPYLCYLYESGHWQLIPFNKIPVEIYDFNLYFDNMAIYRKKFVSLSDKAEMMKNYKYMPDSKRINPNHISG